MEIGQLEAFERAAREGNFTRAAAALGLTQPAISTRISLLERELGGTLFERRGRELQLTLLGEQFLPYARRMLDVMADGLQAVQNVQSGRVGAVKIAAPAPFVLSFLVDALVAFRKTYPAVDVLIRERAKTTIFEMLDDNIVTLGIINAPVYDGRFTRLAHFRDPIRAVVAAGHPLAAYPQPIRINHIYQHTVFRVSMFPEMTAFMDEVVEHGRGGSGGAVIAVPMVMALELVLRGQGVTFLPQCYVQPHVDKGNLIYLMIEDMPRLMSEPVVVCRKDRQADDVHLAFVRTLSAQLKNLQVS